MTAERTIISFDPGKTTGCALARNPVGRTFELHAAFEIPWNCIEGDTYKLLWSNAHTLHAIVIERFALSKSVELQQAQTGSVFEPSQVIGMIRAWRYHIARMLDREIPIVFQTPYDRKLVKILPEHQPIGMLDNSPHARDAYKHLRYYILTHTKEWSE